MRVLVIGCGLVGRELASQLKSDGHYVIGTTTSVDKVERLEAHCDEIRVLRGNEREKVHAAAQGCDAIAVCAGPKVSPAMSPEQRRHTYHDILVETARSAATAAIQGPVVALSSLTVYGDCADHLNVIDEDAPLTDSNDASPLSFQAAEEAYRSEAPERHVIFRCSNITGAEDPPIEAKLKRAHEIFGGSVPLHDQALFYRVHQLDVVRAMKHAIYHAMNGTFNLTHEEPAPQNAEFFNAVCEREGLPKLTFLNEIKSPGQPVSVQRLLETGFTFEFTEPERIPILADVS